MSCANRQLLESRQSYLADRLVASRAPPQSMTARTATSAGETALLARSEREAVAGAKIIFWSEAALQSSVLRPLKWATVATPRSRLKP